MESTYLIIFIDNYKYCECEPEWKILSLSDKEYKLLDDIVDDFEKTRQPFFFPQMYIYPIKNFDISNVKKWIEEKKNNVIKWREEQKASEERAAVRYKKRESLIENREEKEEARRIQLEILLQDK